MDTKLRCDVGDKERSLVIVSFSFERLGDFGRMVSVIGLRLHM